jgi:predicted membrane protein
MTRFHCPDCKRTVTGKKQWLDFFITWLAVAIALELIILALLYFTSQQALTLSITNQTLYTWLAFIIAFAILGFFSPFIAYFIIPEKCPICNLKVSEAEQLEEIGEWERKRKKDEKGADSSED